jgi:arylsulfatase A-like enzyme/Flp pilus assembly protein TadD
VILITLDTTRADRMGFLGSARGLTPSLDLLARQSVVFTHAYAQAPMTTASHASILTGTYPQFHQVRDFAYPLAKDLPYAPAILRAHGYNTAAFLGSLALDAYVSAPGFDRGFDTYDAPFHAEDVWHDRKPDSRRQGSEVVMHALSWLNQHPKGPFFLWVHLFDAHDPYTPPEPYRTKYASEPYDGGIAYEDSLVGELLQELKVRGLYDGAAIAVMADHGESLGAHGEQNHGVFLYDETIQVPLVIKLPGGVGTGRRIENRVELVDVLPTLLQAAKIDVPAEVQGQSLLELIQAVDNGAAPVWRDRPAYAQSDYPELAYGLSALQSLRTGKYLYIQSPRRELYDEVIDANAEHNLAMEMTAVADTLGGRLEDFRRETSRKRESPKVVEDPAAQEKLLALGYVAPGNDFSKAGAAGPGADPKDNIKVVQEVSQIGTLIQAKGNDAAVSMLQQAIATNPGIPTLYFWLGDCYRKLRRYDEAVSALRQALALAPNSTIARIELGLALGGKGDYASAIPEFGKVVAVMPQSQELRLDFASAYSQAGRLPQAVEQYKEVLKINPDNFFASLLLGQSLLRLGDAAASVANLKKAAALRPEEPSPHSGLASAYEQLGKKTEAKQEEAKALELARRAQSAQGPTTSLQRANESLARFSSGFDSSDGILADHSGINPVIGMNDLHTKEESPPA